MRRLEGVSAFQALAHLLRGEGEKDLEWTAVEPAYDRLRAALDVSIAETSVTDLIVLLRQVLLYEQGRRGTNGAKPELIVRHSAFNGANWAASTLRAIPVSGGYLVNVEPWKPEWLGALEESAENRASSEVPCRFGEGSGVDGDPFLSAVGRTTYRSVGQRAAVRAALSTPPGETLAVALATGEGKSLLFQLVQTIGFANSYSRGGATGTTLVIVPTVALALDHEASSLSLPGHRRPLAFRSGAESNTLLVDRIREGTQGLCFVSPEAACGPLRAALITASKAGNLHALIVDEAHLVDQWGTGFRTEFQELSGLRRELLTNAPFNARLRTLLLSATLTDSSLATLAALFGDGNTIQSLSAVSLRPEPDYWVAAPCTAGLREKRVLEVLAHVPRPAILYVTEVKHAEEWKRVVRKAGYRRFRILHGNTSADEREKILQLWRNGSLDLVIGTSAFGLGIDYQHVRSIIHACVPETLDRFYQEVGRAGRDGRASMSISVPTDEDFGAAARLSAQTVISVDRGLVRWNAMFESANKISEELIAVDVDVRPSSSERDIDMVGDRNTDWNIRTLTLLSRAGIIEMVGRSPRSFEANNTRLMIRILDDGHQLPNCWSRRVEPVRSAIAKASRHNLDLMRRYLRANDCPARVFESLYGTANVLSSCSRCKMCRAKTGLHGSKHLPRELTSPWPGRKTEQYLADLIGGGGRLIVWDNPDIRDHRWHRLFSEILQSLSSQGMSKLALIGEIEIDEERAFERIKRRPFFVGRSSTPLVTGLPPGPELVLLGRGVQLKTANLKERNPGDERIFILPPSLVAPEKPDLALLEIFDGGQLSFDKLYRSLTA